MSIRNSVKAIIMQDNHIFLTRNEDAEGVFYLCPGGGQEHGETFPETLQRECMEEIGYEVDIADLLFIREYVGRNHEYAASDSSLHQVEYYFACALRGSGARPVNPDTEQTGAEWIPLHKLLEHRFYPQAMRSYLIRHAAGEATPIYLGDMN